ncbi:MAG TPA: SDR family oxidoreductase, partial [Bacillota bacterium]|nr:SDR family oxidoreductase [Bacillota bacterium]
NRIAYCASKGAILQFSRSLAVDLAYKGIRVNCVCPGPVDTPMMRELTKNRDFEIKQPIPRLGKPDEVAEVVFFLCSAGAAYITGTSVMVDGGFTAM